ncbi:type III secretion system export apparatus subunit SctR [Duganella violaceipulchra]|uniref:Type III secretion protein R n=1 Tax=Duganella violaceipulchra TaxID=2849652 RepID=A0AA41L5P3_9BURK|nr:type III secretion system export apparatus subunit SctR [Duganella violaceicalia]MBV6322452.1 type III secretion system export apparatus subunit SctR [Duganella violaceicalia]MCP2010657.1 type III secretion protein R [Duganella violaceicalia]
MNLNNLDPISIALVLAGLSLLPLLLICTTCFLKVSMVLVIVRNAIGVQQVPPSIAIYGVALALTLFVMAPVFNEAAAKLPGAGAQSFSVADLAPAAEPMRRFMVRNTPPEKRAHFLALAQRQWRGTPLAVLATDSDYVIVIPSFVISELELAFQIGFVLYIPFVVIDLLLSNVLLALGMQMVSPMVVSLPLKMLLFVMLEGWSKLADGLLRSYS